MNYNINEYVIIDLWNKKQGTKVNHAVVGGIADAVPKREVLAGECFSFYLEDSSSCVSSDTLLLACRFGRF